MESRPLRRHDPPRAGPYQLLLIMLHHLFLLHLLHPRRPLLLAAGAELLHVEVEDRGHVEGEGLREEQAADDGEAAPPPAGVASTVTPGRRRVRRIDDASAE